MNGLFVLLTYIHLFKKNVKKGTYFIIFIDNWIFFNFLSFFFGIMSQLIIGKITSATVYIAYILILLIVVISIIFYFVLPLQLVLIGNHGSVLTQSN